MRRRIVNLYLLLNLLNAVLGLGIVVATFFDKASLSILGLMVIPMVAEYVLALPSFWILARSPRVPYRAYIPLVLVYMIPLLLIGLLSETWEVAVYAALLVIPLYCMRIRSRISSRSWGRLTDEDLSQSNFTLTRLWTVLGSILLAAVIVAGASAYRFVRAFVEGTGEDALILHKDGIYTHTITFEKDDKRVLVLGMVHFADREFYEDSLKVIPKNGLVLLEGIMDSKELMGPKFPHPETSYGLANQFGMFVPKVKAQFKSYNADIDLAALTEAQRENEIRDLSEGLGGLLGKSKAERELAEKLGADVKKIRNERLVEVVDQALLKFPTVTITWGAGHNSFITKHLQDKGFKLIEKKEVKAISFF